MDVLKGPEENKIVLVGKAEETRLVLNTYAEQLEAVAAALPKEQPKPEPPATTEFRGTKVKRRVAPYTWDYRILPKPGKSEKKVTGAQP